MRTTIFIGRKGVKFCLFLQVILFVCLPSTGISRGISDSEQAVNYYLDFHTFKGYDKDKTFLEIFEQIPSQSLYFVKKQAGLKAKYKVVIRIYNLEGTEVAALSHNDSISVNDTEQPACQVINPLIRFAFQLKPGRYTAIIKSTDENTQAFIQLQKNLSIPDYKKPELLLSDLQLANSITNTTEEGLLVKNNKKIVPNVPHMYDVSQNMLQVYSEIYNLSFSPDNQYNQFAVTYSITDKFGKEIKQFKSTFEKPGETCSCGIGLPINNLPTGQYTLHQTIRDLDNARIVSKKVTFHINNPNTDFNTKNFVKTLNQLKYIASAEDIMRLKDLSSQDRMSGLQSFWKQNDPTPRTVPNELKIEFYKRLHYSNQNFSTNNQEGWDTEQGKIYIKNGPPDSIKQIKPESNSDAGIYEVWEYNQLNRKYIFVDSWGFGTFRLAKITTNDMEHEYSLHQQEE